MGKNTFQSDQTQYQKFKEAARELDTDQSEEAFDRVVNKVVKAPPPRTSEAGPGKK